MSTHSDEAPAEFTIEEGKPLSKSLVWNLQRAFFAREGLQAWSKGVVPHYISSNPFMADAYVKLIVAFMRDLQLQTDLPADSTLYIVELGAGSGRFSFHIMQRLCNILQKSPLRSVRYKYIMSDFSGNALGFWKNHPGLTPFIKAGLLDFSVFDMERDTEIVLELSGVTISPKAQACSLVVIGNYVFDSLPQDIFTVYEDGKLCEELVTVLSKTEQPDINDPDLLSELNYHFVQRLLRPPLLYYANETINRVLLDYGDRHAAAAFTFPIAGMQCIERLLQLSSANFLLLAADKGEVHAQSLNNRLPRITSHGSISLNVNFHAIGQYVAARGGEMLSAPQQHNHIGVIALLSGGGLFEETKLAFEETVRAFGPDDYYTLRQGFKPHFAALHSSQLLAYIRWTSWDAKSFLDLYPVIMRKISEEEDFQASEWAVAIAQIWERYFPIGEQDHICLYLGLLLYAMDYDLEAIPFFQIALEHYGPLAKIHYYLGACCYNLGQYAEAAQCIEHSLSLDPSLEESRKMQLRIEEEKRY